MSKSSIRAAAAVSLLTSLGISGSALAQGAPAAPAPPAIKTLPLASAIEVAQAALASCKASGYNVTVMIMDQDYAPRLVLRADGARGGTTEIARRKAYTVIKTGMTSGEFGKSIPAPATPPAPRAPGTPPPGVNGDDNLITFAGGKPIKVGGDLLGAISVSGAPGGDKDEACVDAGLAKIK